MPDRTQTLSAEENKAVQTLLGEAINRLGGERSNAGYRERLETAKGKLRAALLSQPEHQGDEGKGDEKRLAHVLVRLAEREESSAEFQEKLRHPSVAQIDRGTGVDLRDAASILRNLPTQPPALVLSDEEGREPEDIETFTRSEIIEGTIKSIEFVRLSDYERVDTALKRLSEAVEATFCDDTPCAQRDSLRAALQAFPNERTRREFAEQALAEQKDRASKAEAERDLAQRQREDMRRCGSEWEQRAKRYENALEELASEFRDRSAAALAAGESERSRYWGEAFSLVREKAAKLKEGGS